MSSISSVSQARSTVAKFAKTPDVWTAVEIYCVIAFLAGRARISLARIAPFALAPDAGACVKRRKRLKLI